MSSNDQPIKLNDFAWNTSWYKEPIESRYKSCFERHIKDYDTSIANEIYLGSFTVCIFHNVVEAEIDDHLGEVVATCEYMRQNR